ncbi:MAG: SMR family transporter [Salinisphaera sp.]|uniref:DMT family transporter n=1 Tax=Salinisphaera sp. TaxID=1914330 RepID=UPI003C7CE768
MPWLWLFAAGACEIVGVVGFARISHGRRVSGALIAGVAFSCGLACLHIAMNDLPMAVAYGVFTGLGALGSTAIGIVFWGESARPARLAWVAGLVVAVVGLKLSM